MMHGPINLRSIRIYLKKPQNRIPSLVLACTLYWRLRKIKKVVLMFIWYHLRKFGRQEI